MTFYINIAILTLCNCFWFWYLATTKQRLRKLTEPQRMRQRCIELGHDPKEHGL